MREAAISLPDGRQLGYGEVGAEDGVPVLHFPGSPGARQSALDEAGITAAGVRLLTLERPGIGLSTRMPGRRLLDWPADVEALADQLAIERFGVVATSAGGPYAFVCGARLSNRVTGIALRATVGQAYDRPEHDHLAPGHTAPVLALIRAGTPASELRENLRAMADLWNADPDGGWQFFLAMLPPAVRDGLPEGGGAFRAAMSATFADAEGYTDDRVVALSSWGFDLGEVAVPVRAWHGTADTTSAIDGVRPVIAAAHGELVEVANGTHFLPPTVDREICDWLAALAD